MSKVTEIQRFRKSKTDEPHAGPELDARVAAAVMGWKLYAVCPERMDRRNIAASGATSSAVGGHSIAASFLL
jgi:hypothetical protein